MKSEKKKKKAHLPTREHLHPFRHCDPLRGAKNIARKKLDLINRIGAKGCFDCFRSKKAANQGP